MAILPMLGLLCLGGLDRGFLQIKNSVDQEFVCCDDCRLAAVVAGVQFMQIGDAQSKADARKRRGDNVTGGRIGQMPGVLLRVVADHHGCSGDLVAAARGVGSSRVVGGSGPPLV